MPKAGGMNEFGQSPENWQGRIEVARQRQRPGDILVLAEEAPNRVLEFEALRTAAGALLDLKRPGCALAALDRARVFDPDDVQCRQLEGIALGLLARTRTLDARPEALSEPAHVVLFSGHMVDRPGREPPRFPEHKAEAATARIASELDALGVGQGDLGISQAAAGGDQLFMQACLARGMRLEVHLPQREPEFLRASVSYAAPRWQRDYDALKGRQDIVFRIMPDELWPAPESVGIYNRCNRWMLHTALSYGPGRISFVTLWDGKSGDGPGGTGHMVESVRKLSGRQPAIINPATL